MNKFSTVIVLCAAGALSACQSQQGAGFAQTSPTYAVSGNSLNTAVASEGAVIAALNAERGRAGLSALTYNGQLTRAARAHAADQIKNDFFSHTGSNGSSVSDRVKATGYSYCLVAENILRGLNSAEAATTAWMNSAGHRRNILHRDFTEVGVAIGDGGHYVAVFADPC